MKITKRRLKRLIKEAVESTSLEYKAAQEMGKYANGPLSDMTADELMSYLDDTAQVVDEGENVPYEATVEYVKSRFPELSSEIDEMFVEGGPRVMEPVFEAFQDLVDNNYPMASAQVLQGEEGSFKVSDVRYRYGSQNSQGYRWWMWGNLLDPIPLTVDASGTDRDGRTWSIEEIFQEITGGKTSKFRTAKS
jgi:hypothetical protein